MRSQVFYAERHATPQVGSTIQFTPQAVNLKDPVELAWAAIRAKATNATRILYKQVGLAKYEVVSLEDMTKIEIRHALRAAEARSAKRLFNVVMNVDKASASRSSQAKRLRSAATSGGELVAASDSAGDAALEPDFGPEAALAAFDADLEQEADAALGDDEGDLFANLDPDEALDMVEAATEASDEEPAAESDEEPLASCAQPS